jgi:hypothetical protein
VAKILETCGGEDVALYAIKALGGVKRYNFIQLTLAPVAYPGILFGGVQQIQLRTEDRENGDLGAVAP